MRILDLTQGRQSPQEAFIDAILLGQKLAPRSTPNILSFYPASYNNPFQSLLYCESKKYNFIPVPFSNFYHLGNVNWGNSSFVHIHWLKKILTGSTSQNEAKTRTSEFERKLLALRKGGHKIIWTIHNILPHKIEFEESEIKIRNLLAQNADYIHILTKDSQEQCAPYFKIPKNKIYYTPHPLYKDFYQNFISKEEAKFYLNLNNQLIFLFFGSLEPYKNIELLIESFKIITNQKNIRYSLLIVGKANCTDYLERLTDLSSNCEHIKIIAKKIDVEKVQYYFNACDYVLIPYSNILNSGAVSLSMSFKKPVIAPNISCVRELYGENYPFLFEKNNKTSFLKTIEKATQHLKTNINWKTPFKQNNSKRVSKVFFQHLTKKKNYA